MLELLKERKAALEAQGKKGFTLMEMLIVIAIIAILIAIAIPVLSAQLNNSKDAADEANARSIYALVQADVMSPAGSTTTAVTWAAATGGGGTATVTLSNDTTQAFEFSDRTTGVAMSGPDTNGIVTVTLSSAGGDKTFGTTGSGD